MDIHRCRFVPYKASAINAVAFSHPHLPADSKFSRGTPARMAIGRANGDIEIWNPMQGSWLQETTIPGGHDRSVEGLAWVVGDDEELDDGTPHNGQKSRSVVSHGQLRLFSIGYTNTITEWDLEKGCAKQHASGQHGELWCLATQPKAAAPAKGPASSQASTQRLVGGTIDGCLALYTTDDDELRFMRLCRTPKKNVKIVSIAFQTRQLAVAGCSDGTIRVFDIRNGAMLHAMTMGRDLLSERAPGPSTRNVIVWSVRCLPNGDIVSGDSTGQICIWDGATYTQAQRIQSHTQDVLSLATSADGSSIVSGGMDRRVVLYREMAGQASSRWAKVWHRRYHQHDVKALAAFEAKGMSVVVAGGPDAAPVVLPLEKSGTEHHRTLSHLPQAVPVASAPDARLVICWWERRIDVWAFDTPLDQVLGEGASPEAGAEAEAFERNRRLVGRIVVKGDAYITAAAISADGSLVVAGTTNETKAFQLRKVPSGGLAISKVAVPASVASKGASGVAIATNGRWVCLSSGVDSHVTVIEALPSADASGTIAFRAKAARLARLRRSVPRHELYSGLGRYDRRIVRLAFSPDSKLLATADLAGYIDTWILRGPDGITDDVSGTDGAGAAGAAGEDGDDAMPDVDEEDSDDSSDEDASDAEDDSNGIVANTSNKWIRNPRAKQLPKLSGAPVVLSFSADVPGAPAVAGEPVSSSTAARDYVLLAVTATSRLFAFNPLRARLVPWLRRLSPANLPVEYRNIRDLAKGLLWQGPRVWIYGTSFLFMVDTSVEPQTVTQSTTTASTDKPSSSASTDVVAPAEPAKRKRKRGDDSGAGSRMQRTGLDPQRVQMAVGGEWVDVAMEDAENKGTHSFDGNDDDDDDDDDESEDEEEEEQTHKLLLEQQQQQQQQAHQSKKSPRKTRKQQKDGSDAAEADADKQLQKHLRSPQPQQPRWWHTFKYRPILGVVPLSSTTTAPAASSGYPALEVALIERPGWDIDLPLRYDE
ncbi:U3 small nucleolar RNA-associated protein 4 [Sporothrix schenckii 1099-18]|uniref:U3 small nucleolar RNA-associated protein 4 n=1 Tax=Sporothrix schenckii 1099-18 TaxID=1397361 RepID=A0A0F2LTR6_SPOSC|nr:U3 small nucleolar RNA-associated protein 4 [Sporothrix schenckii 1099-18]KJR80872.1 U3 small nucleolar RNA-associated protein 4 [Sporothrix schenckii 1099-18]